MTIKFWAESRDRIVSSILYSAGWLQMLHGAAYFHIKHVRFTRERDTEYWPRWGKQRIRRKRLVDLWAEAWCSRTVSWDLAGCEYRQMWAGSQWANWDTHNSSNFETGLAWMQSTNATQILIWCVILAQYSRTLKHISLQEHQNTRHWSQTYIWWNHATIRSGQNPSFALVA